MNNKEQLEDFGNGVKQVKVEESYELIPITAMNALAKTFKYGADKYGKNNHLGIPCDVSLGRAARHIYLYLSGDTSEDHLGHAITRLAMAIDSKSHEEQDEKILNYLEKIIQVNEDTAYIELPVVNTCINSPMKSLKNKIIYDFCNRECGYIVEDKYIDGTLKCIIERIPMMEMSIKDISKKYIIIVENCFARLVKRKKDDLYTIAFNKSQRYEDIKNRTIIMDGMIVGVLVNVVDSLGFGIIYDENAKEYLKTHKFKELVLNNETGFYEITNVK